MASREDTGLVLKTGFVRSSDNNLLTYDTSTSSMPLSDSSKSLSHWLLSLKVGQLQCLPFSVWKMSIVFYPLV